MINHHPTMQTLTDFAAGSLPFGQALCVSIHQEHCPECQRHLRALNGLGGELMAQLEPAAVGDDMLDSIMAQITSGADEQRPATRPDANWPGNTADAGTPHALAKLLPGGLNAVPWKRATSSLSTSLLRVGDDSTQVSLIRMKPGGQINQHDHHGDEFTVVIKGGFSDNRGSYSAGDFITCTRDDRHQPVAHQNEDCICLAAQAAPIKFTGLKGMLLNPLVEFSPG